MNLAEVEKIIQEANKVAQNRPKHLRYGQAFFNALPMNVKEAIRATDADPFYQDKRVPAAIDRIYRMVDE